MKAYVASRTAMKDVASQIGAALVERDFTVSYDWTRDMVDQPYRDNLDDSIRAATKMVQACTEVDLFVLVWESAIIGAAMEYGMALAARLLVKPGMIIYIVQKTADDRECIFDYPFGVRVMPTIEAMLADLDSRKDFEALKFAEAIQEAMDSIHQDHEYMRGRDSIIKARRSAERNEGQRPI